MAFRVVGGIILTEQREQLISLIEQHAQIEQENVLHLKSIEKSISNRVARLLLLEMLSDSEKHSRVLSAMLDILKTPEQPKSFWDSELDSFIDPRVVMREVEKHIEIEESMLAHVEREIEQTQDESIKLLLQRMADDEKRHHSMLDEIIRKIHALRR